MKVKDLIEKLKAFDPELPVAAEDWQEEYREPSERAAEGVELVENGKYTNTSDGITRGTFVCIACGGL